MNERKIYILDHVSLTQVVTLFECFPIPPNRMIHAPSPPPIIYWITTIDDPSIVTLAKNYAVEFRVAKAGDVSLPVSATKWDSTSFPLTPCAALVTASTKYLENKFWLKNPIVGTLDKEQALLPPFKYIAHWTDWRTCTHAVTSSSDWAPFHLLVSIDKDLSTLSLPTSQELSDMEYTRDLILIANRAKLEITVNESKSMHNIPFVQSIPQRLHIVSISLDLYQTHIPFVSLFPLVQWETRQWTHNSILEVLFTHFPTTLNDWFDLSVDQRSELAKWVVLYVYGGWYINVKDVPINWKILIREPCDSSKGVTLFPARHPNETFATNLIGCAPNCPLIEDWIHDYIGSHYTLSIHDWFTRLPNPPPLSTIRPAPGFVANDHYDLWRSSPPACSKCNTFRRVSDIGEAPSNGDQWIILVAVLFPLWIVCIIAIMTNVVPLSKKNQWVAHE